MMEVGVANPIAHGHAMTNTLIMACTANDSGSSEKIAQAQPVKTANEITVGTK